MNNILLPFDQQQEQEQQFYDGYHHHHHHHQQQQQQQQESYVGSNSNNEYYDTYYSTLNSHYYDDNNDQTSSSSSSSLLLRFLAGGNEEPLDYSVVSVGVMTLGLLLLVEVIRHQLDHSAIGRPFFKTVLEGVYSELATLGIVELFIFLLHKYYEDLNIARELVFANVHFTLFYTAIFNAFQSVLLAICSTSVSDRLWVQTENLDLDHYVEIREEFDRISELLYKHDDQHHNKNIASYHQYHRRNHSSSDDDNNISIDDNNTTNDEKDYNNNKKKNKHHRRQSKSFRSISSQRSSSLSSWYKWIRDPVFSILYPHLRGKYLELLIQVRFHQLRLFFLESNNLPLHFKVSEYLKKSERTVLQHLVHVSTIAWLFLTGGLNLIYYLMGMVAFITEDNKKVGASLTYIFFSCMILFIIASLIVYQKMKHIFQLIINMKPSDINDKEARKSGVAEQLHLFWAGDPQLVIAMIQFMQFGYALALAILLIFWDELDGPVHPWYYIFAVLVCYTIFLYVMAKVIPQYTLCTSLGYLVNQKHLQETLAQYRLQDAQRKQKRKLLEYNNVYYYNNNNNNYDNYEGNSVVIIDQQGVSSKQQQDNDDMLSLEASTELSSSIHSSSTKDVVTTTVVGSNAAVAALSGRTNQSRLVMLNSGGTSNNSNTVTTINTNSNDTNNTGTTPIGTTTNNNIIITSTTTNPINNTNSLAVIDGNNSLNNAMMQSTGLSSVPNTPPGRRIGTHSADNTPDRIGFNTIDMMNVQSSQPSSIWNNMPQDAKEIIQAREQRRQERRRRRKTVSDGVAAMASMRGDGLLNNNNNNSLLAPVPMMPSLAVPPQVPSSMSTTDSLGFSTSTANDELRPNNNIALLAELVKSDTRSLRDVLPQESREVLLNREKRMRERRLNRKKTVSDGVAMMRSMSGFPTLTGGGVDGGGTTTPTTTSNSNTASPISIKPLNTTLLFGGRRNNKTENSSIMSSSNNSDYTGIGGGAAGAATRPHDDSELSKLKRSEQRARRRQRHKAASASAIIQSWQNISDPTAGGVQQQQQQQHLQMPNLPSSSARSISSNDPPSLSGLLHPPPEDNVLQLQSPSEDKADVDLSETRIVNFVPPDLAKVNDETTNDMENDDSIKKVECDEGDESIASDKSIGALSDVDDVPMVPGYVMGRRSDCKIDTPYSPPMSFGRKLINMYVLPWLDMEKWKHFFLSPRYSTASHVFGTLVCFFLVGHRTEAILTSSHVIDLSDNTWNLKLFVSFWWQVTWYAMFLLGDVFIIILFSSNWPRRQHHDESRTKWTRKKLRQQALVLSAGLDIWITGICVSALFLAEWQRCCSDNNGLNDTDSEEYHDDKNSHRNLGGGGGGGYDEAYDYGTDDYGEDYYDTKYDNYNCCGRWGDRTYDGLGKIEPFTALVALRVLRFAAGSYITKCLHRRERSSSSGSSGNNHASSDPATISVPNDDNNDNNNNGDDDNGDETTMSEGSIFHGPGAAAGTAFATHHNSKTQSMREVTGTALELWEIAIGKYPDIVAKHGEFSSELFQAMLGLRLVETPKTPVVNPRNTPDTTIPPELATEIDAIGNADGREDENEDIGDKNQDASTTPSPHISLSGQQYVNLPPEAQGIIIAGKLGKPVKSMTNLAAWDLPTLNEHHEEDEEHNQVADTPADTTGLAPPSATPMKFYMGSKHGSMEFIVDKDQMVLEAIDEQDMFVAPNAPLTRSLRRCDRRLLPLLNKWVTVDVAMTQFEIVYFEATDVLDNDAVKSTLLALKATKGGKGLRLCDVASGREVVGHLDLSDVTEIHVERDGPSVLDKGQPDLDDLESNVPEVWDDSTLNLYSSEYWIGPDFGGDIRSSHANKHPVTTTSASVRNRRWAKVKEDRLNLVSLHGTLVLRFYSDLDGTEAHLARSLKENDLAGPITKNICLQWAQTIGRNCGSSQLQQTLPHFGDGTNEELRDYLVSVPFHQKEAEKEAAHHVRKRSSTGPFFEHSTLNFNAPASPGGRRKRSSQASHGSTGGFKTLFHSRSFGESKELAQDNVKESKKGIRRAASSGESQTAHSKGSKDQYRRAVSTGESDGAHSKGSKDQYRRAVSMGESDNLRSADVESGMNNNEKKTESNKSDYVTRNNEQGDSTQQNSEDASKKDGGKSGDNISGFWSLEDLKAADTKEATL